jgi:hypothetical protein
MFSLLCTSRNEIEVTGPLRNTPRKISFRDGTIENITWEERSKSLKFGSRANDRALTFWGSEEDLGFYGKLINESVCSYINSLSNLHLLLFTWEIIYFRKLKTFRHANDASIYFLYMFTQNLMVIKECGGIPCKIYQIDRSIRRTKKTG